MCKKLECALIHDLMVVVVRRRLTARGWGLCVQGACALHGHPPTWLKYLGLKVCT